MPSKSLWVTICSYSAKFGLTGEFMALPFYKILTESHDGVKLCQITKESIIENTYHLKISPLPSPKRLRAGRYPLFAQEGVSLPLVSFPCREQAKGGAAVQSRTAHAKRSIGTLAPDGEEGFYKTMSLLLWTD